jgi:6-phosphogluconate dehydrogenase
MQIGVVGLGRMGGNIARRLMRAGHACVVHDTNAEAVDALGRDGATGAATLDEFAQRLDQKPAVAWVMLPAGEITDAMVLQLGERLQAGGIIIDGGNSFYRDDIRRARALREKRIRYLDVGTSGGVWGLERGYCLMVGGERQAVEHCALIFEALAPGRGGIPPTPGREAPGKRDVPAERGWLHTGPVGSGHFVKMVHNGIEYGLMQAYAEGFDILRGRGSEALPQDERYALDLADIAEVWRRGSVISSWLLDLTAGALAADPQLEKFSGRVEDSGEGRWTLDAAIEQAVPAPALVAALFARFRSRGGGGYADKLLSAMRHGFGGHVEKN